MTCNPLRSLVERLSPARMDRTRAPAATPIEIGVASALWEARDRLVPTVDWHEGEPNHGRMSYHQPDVLIRLPDERSVVLRYENLTRWGAAFDRVEDLWNPPVEIVAADGQKAELGHSAAVGAAWRAVVAWRTAIALCLEHEAAAMDPHDAHGLSRLLVDAVIRKAPRKSSETYQHQDRIISWSGERPEDPAPFTAASPWSILDEGVLFRIERVTWRSLQSRHARAAPGQGLVGVLAHPSFGLARLDGADVDRALEDRRLRSIGEAFGTPVATMSPAVTGNARATRIIALAREAISLDPSIADASGAAIAPLVEQHVPRLLNAHAAAVRTARGCDAVAIDAELDEGLEIVRHAIENALAGNPDESRENLRTELRFLRLRHPEAVGREKAPEPPAGAGSPEAADTPLLRNGV